MGDRHREVPRGRGDSSEGDGPQDVGAMREMQAKGVQIKQWSPEIIAAFEKSWKEVAQEEAASNPNFKKVYESYSRFRSDYAVWRDVGFLK